MVAGELHTPVVWEGEGIEIGRVRIYSISSSHSSLAEKNFSRALIGVAL